MNKALDISRQVLKVVFYMLMFFTGAYAILMLAIHAYESLFENKSQIGYGPTSYYKSLPEKIICKTITVIFTFPIFALVIYGLVKLVTLIVENIKG